MSADIVLPWQKTVENAQPSSLSYEEVMSCADVQQLFGQSLVAGQEGQITQVLDIAKKMKGELRSLCLGAMKNIDLSAVFLRRDFPQTVEKYVDHLQSLVPASEGEQQALQETIEGIRRGVLDFSTRMLNGWLEIKIDSLADSVEQQIKLDPKEGVYLDKLLRIKHVRHMLYILCHQEDALPFDWETPKKEYRDFSEFDACRGLSQSIEMIAEYMDQYVDSEERPLILHLFTAAVLFTESKGIPTPPILKVMLPEQ